MLRKRVFYSGCPTARGLLKKVFEEQIEYVLMYTCKQNEIIHSMR